MYLVYFEDDRDAFPVVTRRDLGYPWGYVEYPRGWKLRALPAACDSDNHFSHPFCLPEWEAEVAKGGGVVIAGPLLLDSGWKVLVAFPPAKRKAKRA